MNNGIIIRLIDINAHSIRTTFTTTKQGADQNKQVFLADRGSTRKFHGIVSTQTILDRTKKPKVSRDAV